jgi:hypothetical protein
MAHLSIHARQGFAYSVMRTLIVVADHQAIVDNIERQCRGKPALDPLTSNAGGLSKRLRIVRRHLHRRVRLLHLGLTAHMRKPLASAGNPLPAIFGRLH